jgi:hypothetical protein
MNKHRTDEGLMLPHAADINTITLTCQHIVSFCWTSVQCCPFKFLLLQHEYEAYKYEVSKARISRIFILTLTVLYMRNGR